MANEFVARNGIIAKANSTITGTLDVSGNITMGSALVATRTWVTGTALSGYATESYVTTAINNLIDAAPGTLDTLNELAAALGDDPNFATTVTNSIATKLPLAGGTMTGNINWTQTDRGLVWTMNTDGAYIKFFNTGDGDANSRLEYATSDNGDEYHRWVVAGTEKMNLKWAGLTVADSIWMGGNLVATQSWVGAQGYLTSYSETDTLATVTARGATTTGNITVNGDLNFTGVLKYGGTTIISNSASDVYLNARVLYSTSTLNDGMYINYNTNGGAGAHLRFFANTTNERMRIDASTGNVGIGTTSPQSLLQVGSISTATYVGPTDWNQVARFTSTNRKTSIVIQASGTDSSTNQGLPAIEFDPYAVDASGRVKTAIVAVDNYYGYRKTDLAFVLDSADDLNPWAVSDAKLYIKNNGNVGIGTTNPIYKLQVAGSAYVNGGTLYIDSDQYIRWGNSNQGIVGSNDNHVSIVSGGATRQSIYADGRTYFPGLDLSISNVNSSHGTGTYFRGSSSHFVLGLSNGNTLYLNYGNDGGTLYSYGTQYHSGSLVVGGTDAYTTGGSARLSVVGNVISFGASNGDLSYFRRLGAGQFQWQTYNSGNNGEIHLQPYGGNVGIGTQGPISRLDIRGAHTGGYGIVNIVSTDSAFISIDSQASDGGLRLKYNTTDQWLVGIRGGDTFHISNASDQYKFSILQSGNVGIGNTNPTAKLQVGAEAHGSATGIEVAAGTGGANLLAIDNANNHNWFPYTDGQNYYSAAAHTFRNATHSVNWMHINSSGNVGIGTTSPAATLHVVGTHYHYANIGAGTNLVRVDQYGIDSNYRLDYKQIVSSGLVKHSYSIVNNGTSYNNNLVLDRGNVGIGTDSPGAKLHVYTPSSGSAIVVGRASGNSSIKASADADGGYLSLDSTGGATIINHYTADNVWLVTGGGNVGVGTAGPTNKLQVANGNMSITTGYSFILADTDTNWRLGRNIISENGNQLTANTMQFVAANAANEGWQFVDDDGNTRFEIGASTGNAWLSSGNLYLNGNLAATRAWVQSQGYLTSYTETDTLATVTARGNIATGDIYVPSSAKFRARYDSTNNYHASLDWYGLQLGNNGANYIIAGRTNAGGKLVFYTNNTSDFTSINGSYAATMHASGRTSFGTDADNGYQVQVYGSLYASDWIRVGGSQGLYFESYGGGFRMTDSTWVRIYNDKNLYTAGTIQAARFEDASDSNYYVDPASTSNIWRLQANDKYHYFGTSSNWDSGSLNGENSIITNVHFQGHPDFWIGAGNTKWYTGVVSGHHDLLINTMQSGGANTRGITFTATSSGASAYRLGRWFAHSNQAGSYLQVDGGVKIGATSDYYSAPTAKLYVAGNTAGADVFAVDGVNGRLFTVTDDLSDSLFSVNTIAGLPIIEAFADNTVKIGRYGANNITIQNDKIAINSDTVDANFPFYVGDRSVAGSRYILTNPGMGFNLADNYAQLQLYGSSGAYLDFVSTATDSSGRIMWSNSGYFLINGDMYFNNTLYTYTLYDRNDGNYYLDMNGTSRLGTVNVNQLSVYGNTYLGDGNGDEVHINDILRVGATDSGDAHFYFGEGGSAGSDYGSHWYWDSGYTFTWYTRNAGTDNALFDYVTNDTTYVNWRRHFHMQGREINYLGQLHFNAGTRFYGNDTHYLIFRTDDTSYGGIQVRDGNSTVRGYSGYFDSNGFGLLNSGGSWGIRLNPGSAETLLFYAGDWRLQTRSGGTQINGNLYTNTDYGHGLVGLYSASRYQGVFAMSDDYKLSADGTSTGNLYGLAWTHTNVGGQSKSGLEHQLLVMNYGVTQTAIGVGIWTAGLITTTSYGTSANWKAAYDWGNHASQGYATQSYVNTAIANLVDSAPDALNTLNELSAALGDDANFATNVTNSIAGKVSKSGDTMSGALTLNGGLNAYAQPILVNEIKFRDTAGSPQSDPYSIRWISEASTRGAGLSWLEFQLNDDNNEEIRIYGNSCVNHGCGAYSDNLYHRFRADGYAWHAGNLEVVGTFSASGYNKSNWDTAYGWGNHSGLYLPISGGNATGWVSFSSSTQGTPIIKAVQQDSSSGYYLFQGITGSSEVFRVDRLGNLVLGGAITAVGYNKGNWDAAYGWGNHADAPYWNTDLADPKTVQSTDVIFSGNVTVQGTFTESSSIRFKENIKPLEPTLGKVEQLNPVSYNKITSQEEEIGLIAEEVVELFPEVVTYNENGEPSGIQYQRLSVILLKAVQELTERVNKLENK